ncbi:Phage Mu protein F like protein [Hymenobacter daecheongensis DSM 21074]|uniref:Phage Mu protein F like protein n=1 Tax=Hymenobacter daecheongensis DSM 21074 TaxID=1121955 RepID=A0A1M6LWS5_9BACT|nr:PBECR2 nuclease fold domain-containing protein [Hymenobacter daecheongensis]SHJ75648.1 Phage Mu protein F like protein [Hymenobacter daecheongensis DSM 21074]
MSDDEEAYLRKFYDDAGSRGWSYDHFQRNHAKLLGAVSEGWAAKGLSHEYGSPDHLTRANFAADVHRFGYDKTVYQTLQLNQLVKDAKDFNAFKTEAGKLLANLNVRQLQTQFNTAKATANATANVLRAVAGGAKFMRHKATQDTHTRPVHNALHNRVWRIDNPKDTEWRRFVVPLGFGCRCQDVFEDDFTGEVITNEEAEQLIGPDEVARLTRDGFLLDRVDKKMLFSQKQSYLNGLKDPEQIAYQMGKMQYADQGQQPWAKISKSALPPMNTPTGLKASDALKDFDATATNGVKRYTDYTGQPLFLEKSELEFHLQDKYTRASENRQGIYFQIEDIISDPDEVYFFEFVKKNGDSDLSYTYLKFHSDGVLLAAIEFSKEQPQVIKSWYKVYEPDSRRKGLLIHKK